LHHRGPDAQGVWVEPEAGIALGHARVSIIDLSPSSTFKTPFDASSSRSRTRRRPESASTSSIR
jgi:asparagine synthetase B (glutamine-hydrolysing)